ncbi:RHS repeat-associated core domain-containing protein [Bremerella sp. JC817]|uniref:RHS repeat-associated core domain-containing protein n=1 Tax=Bremerella sp. JC817 TaxID=3231756 RepID=UPI00345A00EA
MYGPNVDQILASEEVTSTSSAGDVLWALTDHLGTVRDLVDYNAGTDTTTVQNHLAYNSFGNIVSETSSAVDFLFAFTGRERDEENDLQYNRARYYDAAVGKWISEDPIGFGAGDVNLSRYVFANPLAHSDPSGLKILKIKRVTFNDLGMSFERIDFINKPPLFNGYSDAEFVSLKKPGWQLVKALGKESTFSWAEAHRDVFPLIAKDGYPSSSSTSVFLAPANNAWKTQTELGCFGVTGLGINRTQQEVLRYPLQGKYGYPTFGRAMAAKMKLERDNPSATFEIISLTFPGYKVTETTQPAIHIRADGTVSIDTAAPGRRYDFQYYDPERNLWFGATDSITVINGRQGKPVIISPEGHLIHAANIFGGVYYDPLTGPTPGWSWQNAVYVVYFVVSAGEGPQGPADNICLEELE